MQSLDARVKGAGDAMAAAPGSAPHGRASREKNTKDRQSQSITYCNLPGSETVTNSHVSCA